LGYTAVENYMIHGPCGDLNRNSVCMEGNKCTKHFPKKFNSETTMDEEGFPVYRRRDDGKRIKKVKQKLTTDLLCHTIEIYWSNSMLTSMWSGAT
jgi:hypothetical protein